MIEHTIDGIPFIEDKIITSMPYMGNKRKLATKILNSIYETVGEFDNLYDMFGGGGSVSIAGYEAGHEVHYNEFNEGVYNLFKHVLTGDVIPTEWVSRKDFFKHVNGNDWYSGFVKIIYSFGNNQKSYIYGQKIEELKRLSHESVINNDSTCKKELGLLLGITFPDIIKDRKHFMKILRDAKVGIKRTQHLERIDKLKEIEHLERTDKLKRIDKLKEIQHLERTDKLKQINKMNTNFSNLSYDKVIINPVNSVIYCDPPYKDTAGYQCEINHEDFYKWCLDQDCPVFISEYNMPDDFTCIAEFKHTASNSATTNKVIEKLFWNGKGLLK